MKSFSEYINESKQLKYIKKNEDGDLMNQLATVEGNWKMRKRYNEEMEGTTLAFFNIPPKLYVDLVDKIWGYQIDDTKMKNIRDFVEKGGKIPYSWFDFDGVLMGGNYQDGMHRANLAYELGVKKIPIIVSYREKTLPKELNKYFDKEIV